MNFNLSLPEEHEEMIQKFMEECGYDELSFEQFTEILLAWLDENGIEYRLMSDQEYDDGEMTQH